MNYKKDLLEKIKDSSKWPFYTRPEFLRKLDILADNAYAKKTTDGYLSSLLIYQQLCEEMVKLLIQCSDFFIQCSVYPIEYKNTKTKKKMFGQLINMLNQGVQVRDLDKFILKCEKMNELRIKMVHKLTLKTSISDIKKQIKPVKKLYNEIYGLFDDIYDYYRQIFHDIKKDKEF